MSKEKETSKHKAKKAAEIATKKARIVHQRALLTVLADQRTTLKTANCPTFHMTAYNENLKAKEF